MKVKITQAFLMGVALTLVIIMILKPEVFVG